MSGRERDRSDAVVGHTTVAAEGQSAVALSSERPAYLDQLPYPVNDERAHLCGALRVFCINRFAREVIGAGNRALVEGRPFDADAAFREPPAREATA